MGTDSKGSTGRFIVSGLREPEGLGTPDFQAMYKICKRILGWIPVWWRALFR